MGQKRAWEVNASTFARNTHNPIRHIVDTLDLQPNPDKQMIALSIGDPTIFGNLNPPQEAIEAVKDVLLSNSRNGYAPSTGFLEARQAVAEFCSNQDYVVSPEDIILCSGCSGALDLCISTLADVGQNILVPRPGFSIYRTIAQGLGIRVKEYNLIPEQKWEADLDSLESQIDENTAAIIVINPSNPCGSVYREDHLKDIVNIASRNCVPIIADEIYENLVFKGEQFVRLASVSKDVPILECGGLAKRFLVPGWRMGWIVIHDRNNLFAKEVKESLIKVSQRIIGSNTLIQGALPLILKSTPKEFFDDLNDTLEKNAKLAFSLMKDIEGLKPIMPQGAMYMMVGVNMKQFPHFKDGLEFVTRMVSEESVFCLPGECFNYEGYMRIVLTVPEDMIIIACSRISDFCRRHSNLTQSSKSTEPDDLPYIL